MAITRAKPDKAITPHARKNEGAIMAKAIFGNHSSALVPRTDRDSIRQFYCDVLGGKVTKADPERDFLRLGEDFYVVFLYGDVSDESEFLRTGRSVWLEIKSDNVEELSRKILESGLVKKLEVPDPHLYFQAPGGQCMRLVGIDEDLSFYEGAGEGSNVAKVKEALGKMSRGSPRPGAQ
jgi:catechol 2,3-dioxygenase-like lactoylglutathione lyase family enzyme